MPERPTRFGGQWGWQGCRPKEGDLLVVTSKDSEFCGQVMRLNSDKEGWQTVVVGDNLLDQYGLNVSLYRKDLRPLTGMDKVVVQ